MKIYTKKGDRLMTSLYNGLRVKKDHERIQLLGQIDEVVARFCLALSHTEDKIIQPQVEIVTTDLMKLMSYLAHGADLFKENHTLQLELWIDQYTDLLPPLNHFIQPYNDVLAAHFNMCRTAVRETERLYAHIVDTHSFDPLVAQYLNRLSDYAFMLVRYSLHINQREVVEARDIKDE